MSTQHRLTIVVTDDDLLTLDHALAAYESECRFRAEQENDVEVWTEANDFFLEQMETQRATARRLRTDLEAAASGIHERLATS